MPDITAEDLPEEYDVAIVVFARCRGVDRLDASDRAKQGVTRALADARVFGPRDAQRAGAPMILPLPHTRDSIVVGGELKIYRTMDVGTAAGNGYLSVQSTRRARREMTGDEDD